MARFTREELVKKLHIELLSYDDQQAMLQNVANVVQGRIMNGIGDKLQEPDLIDLERLVDVGNEQEVEDFIRSKFDNYDKFAAETEAAVVEDIAKDIAMSHQLLNKSDANNSEATA